ncbi:IclR family transcriptional regulator [Alcaligenaceae bacterium]|nr:IclR family transcriptional regulator [Alcaligenaceae bacterium]
MNVKTAGRTLDVFEVFASKQKPLNLSELAHELDIPVSSCFALVRTLESRGYLYMMATRKDIYPTRRILDVANTIAASDVVLERVGPILTELRDVTGETAVISKRQGDQIVYLDVCNSEKSIRYYSTAGEFKMMHSSSVGKAFLGALTNTELDKTLSRLKLTGLTPHTLTTRKALKTDLRLSRERGWYTNISESVVDLVGVAVTAEVGNDRYGISIVGPEYRIIPTLDFHAKALLHAKQRIEENG